MARVTEKVKKLSRTMKLFLKHRNKEEIYVKKCARASRFCFYLLRGLDKHLPGHGITSRDVFMYCHGDNRSPIVKVDRNPDGKTWTVDLKLRMLSNVEKL